MSPLVAQRDFHRTLETLYMNMKNDWMAFILLTCCLHSLDAQIHPALPFDALKMEEQDIRQVVRWKGVYAKTDADTTGFRWSETKVMDFQEMKYKLRAKGLPQEHTRYNVQGNAEERMSYYYPEGELSAIDEFYADSTGELQLAHTYVYAYDTQKRPAQRVRIFRQGPERRILAAYTYAADGQLKRIRYEWSGPDRRPVNLALMEYHPQERRIRYYKNLHTLDHEERYVYREDGQLKSYTVLARDGTARSHSLLFYENERCIRKVTFDTAQPDRRTEPIMRCYYSYNSAGLLEMELREIGEEQTVYTYTYLKNK